MEKMIRFFKDEEGATAVEYGLMVALIAIGIILSVQGVRDALIALFNRVAVALG
jgi:pilus assembly protein Flp/PilA